MNLIDKASPGLAENEITTSSRRREAPRDDNQQSPEGWDSLLIFKNGHLVLAISAAELVAAVVAGYEKEIVF